MISALLIGLFLVFMFIGFPVSVAIGVATIAAMLAGGYNLMVIPQAMADSAKGIEIMAVPFFILAANLMTALGITQRIFEFATALVGSFRGGLAYANVVAGTIFSGISGAAVADAAALGAISMKEMPRAGYPRPFSAAVVVAVATLGPIIPPSIMMVIYAIVADVSVARMFLAGLLPGLLIGAMIMAQIWLIGRLGWVQYPPRSPFSARDLGKAFLRSFLALLAPIVILRAMAIGVATPTEAGILAVFYSIAVGFVYRNLSIAVLRKALRDTVVATALIMYIFAISSALSWVFVAEGTAMDVTTLITEFARTPFEFLFFANILLLVLGCLIETLPAMLLVLPILLPAAKALGIDLVHFGIVVIFNLVVGIITPPMGIGLYILMAIGRVEFGELVRASVPFIGMLLLALVLLTAFPWISLVVPDLLMSGPAR